VILVSHTADLAHHFGRQVREIVTEHAARLGYQLSGDSRSSGRWRTNMNGQYYAVGVRGPLAGRRSDLAIVDDPIKSYAEADSASFREHLWNWYRADLLTRLRPGGRVVIIMTRWHEDDLGGRLLSRYASEWRVVRLPALAEADDLLGRETGDALWPDWEDAAALVRKRETIGERSWSALFQQAPQPASGSLFKRSRIEFIDAPFAAGNARCVRAWDLAASQADGDNDPDWTVGLKMLRADDGRFVVLDVVRLRGSPNQITTTIVETARCDGRDVVVCLPQDPGQAGKYQVSWLTSQLAGFQVIASRESGSKATRAGPVSSQIEAGNIAVIRGQWNHAFLDELRDFPNGRKDDQVDALSRAFATLTDTVPAARRLHIPLMAR
jgi:predicted phage terminase large subunit-like protein